MKRTIFILSTLVLLASCGSSKAEYASRAYDGTSVVTQASTPGSAIWQSPDYGPPEPFSMDKALASGYHPEPVPGSISWEGVQVGMHACVHLPTSEDQQWNAVIVGKDVDEGNRVIRLDEYLPRGVRQNASIASGYGLEPDPTSGNLYSPMWMTPGSC